MVIVRMRLLLDGVQDISETMWLPLLGAQGSGKEVAGGEDQESNERGEKRECRVIIRQVVSHTICKGTIRNHCQSHEEKKYGRM